MLPTSTSLYLDELLYEMSQLSDSPIDFKNTRILLSKEISRVFEGMNRNDARPVDPFVKNNIKKNGFFSPQVAPRPFSSGPSFSPFNSPFSASSSSSPFQNSGNPFMTPIKSGKIKYPEQNLGDWTRDGYSGNNGPFVLQTKIYIPIAPTNSHNGHNGKYNYIGRILGPSGTSARMFESEFDVTLLIRGAGSMKDAETEESFRGKKRYEHLDEPLHVLLIARHDNKQTCEEMLEKAAEKIESLLIPVNDEYKKEQLVRYAIMNGTYEERTDKPPHPTANKRRSNRNYRNCFAPNQNVMDNI